MENKEKPAAIDIKDSSNIRMTNIKVGGYETALRAENTHNMYMKNFSAGKNNRKVDPKWYKDRNFIIALIGVIAAVVFGYLTLK